MPKLAKERGPGEPCCEDTATSRAALCPQRVLSHLQIRIPFRTKQEVGSPSEASPAAHLCPHPPFPMDRHPPPQHVTPARHPCLSGTSQQRGVGWMVVVVVGECCEMSTGSNAPPTLELTLFTHHAPCHNLTQRNATRRTTTPHSTMQQHPPWRSTGHATQCGATAPEPANSIPTQHLLSQISPKPLFPKLLISSTPHAEGVATLCSLWLGGVLMVVSLGSLEHPGHPPSRGALAGALCGYGGV